MNFFPVIRFHDKSFRVITHAQKDSILKAYKANAKYIQLDGDIISLSSVSRIESAKFLCAEMGDNIDPFGYPHLSEKRCMQFGFLPLSQKYINIYTTVQSLQDEVPEEYIAFLADNNLLPKKTS